MKYKLLFVFLALTQTLFSQTFTEISPVPPFDGVGDGSIAFSDVDGDGDEDVLITGQDNSDGRIAKLYINDGAGSFTEMTDTPFDGVQKGSIAFSDVNGDGWQDVLITGLNSSEGPIAKLYINDGTGSFTEMTDTPFDGVIESSIAFSDVNGDGNDDVLIAGRKNFEEHIAKLYTNDGTGSFTEMAGTSFDGVDLSAIAFSDVNGDGNNDVLITGRLAITGLQTAKLYTNDGTGSFIEITDTPFLGVIRSSIAFSDVDGDGDEDVLITGAPAPGLRSMKLYTNDGTGNFSEITDTPFDGVRNGSIAFSDINGDGNDDLLITGQDNSDERIAELYTNDGTGNFTEITDNPFNGVHFSSIAFSDVNGDGWQDVLITGLNSSDKPIAKLYINDGVASHTEDLEIENSLGFALFPNPSASGTINLSYDSAKNGELTINMYHSNGVLLSQQREFTVIGPHTFTINLNPLVAGIYFIEMDNGERRGLTRFIVK